PAALRDRAARRFRAWPGAGRAIHHRHGQYPRRDPISAHARQRRFLALDAARSLRYTRSFRCHLRRKQGTNPSKAPTRSEQGNVVTSLRELLDRQRARSANSPHVVSRWAACRINFTNAQGPTETCTRSFPTADVNTRWKRGRSWWLITATWRPA